MRRASGHALTVYVNAKQDCFCYASKELQALATDTGASTFFREQLAHNFSPGQALISRYVPVC